MMREKTYNRMIESLEGEIYDGRGRGVGVYRCERCGEDTYTAYADLGVTPFVITCPVCGCESVHMRTVRNEECPADRRVLEFARPSYGQYRNLPGIVREHVERGGLMLREDIDKLTK